MSEEARVRIFRIHRPRPDRAERLIQYGYWHRSRTGIAARFAVLREWPAKDLAEAEALQARLRLDILLDPKLQPEPEAAPLERSFVRKRKVSLIPPDCRRVLKRAVDGLTDPLPSIEESSKRMEILVPRSFRDGVHFGSYLNQVTYRKLVALAASAGVSRNRLIEVLVLAAEDAVHDRDEN